MTGKVVGLHPAVLCVICYKIYSLLTPYAFRAGLAPSSVEFPRLAPSPGIFTLEHSKYFKAFRNETRRMQKQRIVDFREHLDKSLTRNVRDYEF